MKRKKELREKREGVGQLLIDGNNKLKSSVKSSVKSSDKAVIHVSAVDGMVETATELSQKHNKY